MPWCPALERIAGRRAGLRDSLDGTPRASWQSSPRWQPPRRASTRCGQVTWAGQPALRPDVEHGRRVQPGLCAVPAGSGRTARVREPGPPMESDRCRAMPARVVAAQGRAGPGRCRCRTGRVEVMGPVLGLEEGPCGRLRSTRGLAPSTSWPQSSAPWPPIRRAAGQPGPSPIGRALEGLDPRLDGAWVADVDAVAQHRLGGAGRGPGLGRAIPPLRRRERPRRGPQRPIAAGARRCGRGYGVDEHGCEFAVALDVGLAADIVTALDDGQRPIVAVEKPLYPRATAERAVVDQIMTRRDTRSTGGKPQPSDPR